MSKNTKIIATIVPLKIEGNDLHFSVFLSPRLPDSGKLIDYYEILNWPRFHQMFTANKALSVQFGSETPDRITPLGDPLSIQNVIKKEKMFNSLGDSNLIENVSNKKITESFQELAPTPDKFFNKTMVDMWSRLFNGHTPVSGWVLNEYEPEEVVPVFQYNRFIGDLRKNVALLKKNLEKDRNQFSTYFEVEDDFSFKVRTTVTDADKKTDLFKNQLSRLTVYQLRKQILEREDDKNDEKPVSLTEWQQTFASDVSRVDDLRIQEYFSKPARTISEDEVNLKNKLNQEFHKKFSIMADYPHLMRMCGWIYDFSIDISARPELRNKSELCIAFSKIWNYLPLSDSQDPTDTEWLNFLDEVDFKCPWTAIHIRDNSFTYRYKTGSTYFKVNSNGYVESTEFHALQKDPFKDYKDPLLNGNQSFIDDQSSNPTSQGITLEFKLSDAQANSSNMPSILLEAEQQEVDKMIIYGHLLDVGFIVDVRTDKGVFSLCSRTCDYVVDRSPYKDKSNDSYLFTRTDEGHVMETAQEGDKGPIINHEITRWNNWSLVCPQPGDYSDFESEVTKREALQDKYFNDIELRNQRPEKGTLPPLRYGKPYSFRMRVQDICGNAPLFEVRKNQPYNPGEWKVLDGKSYLRKEPLAAPDIFLDRKYYKSRSHDGSNELKPAYRGEKADTIVVRTYFKNGNADPAKESVRWFSAPRVAYHFAEAHQVFDKILSDENNRALVLEKAATDFSEKGKTIAIGSDKLIPYFTDPVVESIGLVGRTTLIRLSDPKDLTEFNEVKYLKENYLNRNFQKIIFTGKKGALNGTAINIIQDKTIEVVPGQEATLELYCATFGSDQFKKLWDTSTPPAPLPYKTRKIAVIHAVQKPVYFDGEAPGSIPFKNTAIERTVNDPYLYPRFEFSKLPVASVEYYNLYASYTEIIVDENMDEKKLRGKKFKRTDNGYFEVSHSNVLVCRHVARSLLIGEAGEENLRQMLGTTIATFKYENDVIFQGSVLRHNLKGHQDRDISVRHHDIRYTLECVSRFRNYFPENVHDFSIKTEDSDIVAVKSSIAPAVPEIDYVVPMFEWETGNAGSKVRSARRNRKFRIYFKNRFYTTGKGEQIAILIHEKYDTVFDETEEFVSQFGADPISKPPNGPGATGGYADIMTKKGLLKEYFVTDKHVLVELRKFTDEKNLKAVEKNTKLTALLFELKFSQKKRQWYTDVELTKKFTDEDIDTYAPFIRFAITTYQQHAVETNTQDLRFSKIALTNFLQLLPSREVVYDKKQKNISLQLKPKHISFRSRFFVTGYRSKKEMLEEAISPEMPSKEMVEFKRNADAFEVGFKELSETLNQGKINLNYLKVEEYEDFRIQPDKIDPISPESKPRINHKMRLVFQADIKI